VFPTLLQLGPADASPFDTVAPAANAAATTGYGGIGGYSHAIGGVAWSYNGTPTGGNLIIQDGSTTIFQIDVTAAGPGFIPFDPPLAITAGNALTATLAAGGSGVSGKVNFASHRRIARSRGGFPAYDFSWPSNSMYL
jgi:hypothetical protein